MQLPPATTDWNMTDVPVLALALALAGSVYVVAAVFGCVGSVLSHGGPAIRG